MSRIRLYAPDLNVNVLSPEESHHAAGVMRCRKGDAVVLFDGVGREALAEIVDVNARRVTVKIGEVSEHSFDCTFRLTLAVSMGKAHRQSYLVEKCTELGVAAIWPMITDRSVTHPGDAAVDKWQRRAIEAAKQSGRRWVPRVETPQLFAEALGRIAEFSAAAIANREASAMPWLSFLDRQPPGCSLLAMIGPEGGWTDQERDHAMQAGAQAVSLSLTILRTETAAVTLCAGAALQTAQ